MTRFENVGTIYAGKGLARAEPFPVKILQYFQT